MAAVLGPELESLEPDEQMAIALAAEDFEVGDYSPTEVHDESEKEDMEIGPDDAGGDMEGHVVSAASAGIFEALVPGPTHSEVPVGMEQEEDRNEAMDLFLQQQEPWRGRFLQRQEELYGARGPGDRAAPSQPALDAAPETEWTTGWPEIREQEVQDALSYFGLKMSSRYGSQEGISKEMRDAIASPSTCLVIQGFLAGASVSQRARIDFDEKSRALQREERVAAAEEGTAQGQRLGRTGAVRQEELERHRTQYLVTGLCLLSRTLNTDEGRDNLVKKLEAAKDSLDPGVQSFMAEVHTKLLADPVQEKPSKQRSNRLLALLRAIESGDSKITVWSAFQMERSWAHVRKRRLACSAEAAVGGSKQKSLTHTRS